MQNQAALATLHTPLQEGPWRTLLLVFFASAIVMPHMYHMTFTENLNPRAMVSASWGLPLFLLLMSLAVPLILWAGLKLGATTNPEYFTLGLGIAVNSETLALLAYIGGLSASSGLIIVSTLALSGMALNHLVLPLYQPPAEGNIYRWLKWTRRTLIACIIMAGYGFYLLLGAQQDLANLGIVAFVATLQFLPGVLSVLYWQTANRRGFIAGLLAGISVWALTMLLPLLGNLEGFYLPLFNVIYVLDDASWHLAAIASLAANVLVFTLMSLFTEASPRRRAPPKPARWTTCAARNDASWSPCRRRTSPRNWPSHWAPRLPSAKWSRRCAICICPSTRAVPMPCAACATASRPTCPA